MVTIEPQLVYGIITTLVGALALAIGRWSSTRSYAGQKQADGQLAEDKSRANALDSLSEIAKQGNVFQQQMIEVVRESTRSNEKNAAEMRGMVAMLDGHGKLIRDTTSALETNLEENIKGQFGPVIEEIKNIGSQIGVLVVDVQSRDGHVKTQLTELVILFKDAEKRFMQMLEPIVLKHMSDLLAPDTAPLNGQEKDHSHEST